MNMTHEHTPTGLPVTVLDDDGVTAELQDEMGGVWLAPSWQVVPLPDPA
jgi:hypothetical protein